MESSNSPLVSIITLTYNNFSDIKSTLKSIFLQNYKEFEFILSDDGSINFPKKIIHYIEENKPIGFKYRILKTNIILEQLNMLIRYIVRQMEK